MQSTTHTPSLHNGALHPESILNILHLDTTDPCPDGQGGPPTILGPGPRKPLKPIRATAPWVRVLQGGVSIDARNSLGPSSASLERHFRAFSEGSINKNPNQDARNVNKDEPKTSIRLHR